MLRKATAVDGGSGAGTAGRTVRAAPRPRQRRRAAPAATPSVAARRVAPGLRRGPGRGASPGATRRRSWPPSSGSDQLFAQGRTGIGQTIAIVEFEKYLPSDFAAFQSCYGLTNSDPQRDRRRWVRAERRQGRGEAALDTELAAVQRALRLPRRLRGAQRHRRPGLRPVQPHRQRRQLPGGDDELGELRGRSSPPGDLQTENGIFQRMALQGQTVIAASGDSGSEDCFDRPIGNTRHRAGRRRPRRAARCRQRRRHLPAEPVGVGADRCGTTARVSGANVSRVRLREQGCGRRRLLLEWPATPGSPTSRGRTNRAGSAPAGRSRTSPTRPTRRRAAWPSTSPGSWSAFGGTSVAAPTNAGLFADTNQGCFSPLGPRRSRALRGAAGEQRQLHRHHVRQQRLHRHQRRRSSRRRPASTPPAASARPSTRTSPSPCRARTGAPRWRR